MMRRVIGRIIKVLLFLILAIVVFGQIVYRLWNWLIPNLFHLPAVTFWQAVGLLALSWILFGGWRGHRGGGWGSRGPWRGRMQERWEQMTPEEREKFRAGMGRRCAPASADTGAKL
jgi:hypothetical protein